MKRILSVSLLTIGVAVMLASNASGQSIGMKVHIPFDFSVGDNSLPAGYYGVRLISSVLSLEGSNGNVAAVLTHAIRAKDGVEDGHLVFSRYGDAYFLSSAFWQGYGDGRDVVKSKGELELLARNSKTKIVTLNTKALVRR